MKTLKSIILGAIILVTFGTAKANTPKADNDAFTIKRAVTTYINAIAHGKIAGLDAVIDQNAEFTMLRGKAMLSFNKTEVLESLKNDEDIEQNCTTTSSVTQSNSDITVVKVDMKYSNFTRTNYVTLTNTTDGWKITNVYSVFK